MLNYNEIEDIITERDYESILIDTAHELKAAGTGRCYACSGLYEISRFQLYNDCPECLDLFELENSVKFKYIRTVSLSALPANNKYRSNSNIREVFNEIQELKAALN